MFKGLRYNAGEFANYETSGHYMYRQFNIQQFYVLPAQCIYVFCVDLRKTEIISVYNINWLLFITETECVYCAVRIIYVSLNTVEIKFILQMISH